MTTKLDVINGALRALGEPSTRDVLSSEKWVRRLVDAHDAVVTRLFEQHPWNFAEEAEQLTATLPTPIDFQYGYNQPAACSRINHVADTPDRKSPGIYYRHRAGRILTNATPAYVWYVSRRFLDLPGAWPALFADAVSKELAAEVGPVTTASNSKDETLVEKARKATRKAQHADAQNNAIWKPPAGAYLTARYSVTGRRGEDG